MKTYEAIFNEKETKGVFGISLVENPAMEGNFVALNKQEKIQLQEIDKEKRILLGLVLEPNKPIYRNQNGEEFNIVFSNEVVKDLSYNFFKSDYHKNSTIEHDTKQRIEGVTFVESWIVEDTEKDKSNIYGFSYPVGSWLAVMKVDSDDIWNEYVKSGKVQGFSVDAMLTLKEVNLKSNIKMSDLKEALKGFKDDILQAISLSKKEDVKLGMVKDAKGELTFEYDGEMLEVGGSVWLKGEDGERVSVPEGEYPLEDGKILSIDAEGLVAGIGEAEKPQEETPMAAEPTASPQADMVDQLKETIKSVMIKYAAENDAKIEALKQEIVKLSEQPAEKKIVAAPSQNIALTKQGRILKQLRNK